MKLRNKLLLSFGTVLTLTVIVGVSGYNGVMQITPRMESMYTDRLIPAVELDGIMERWSKIRTRTLLYSINSDPAQRRQITAEIAGYKTQIDSLVQTYAGTYLTSEERENFKSYLSLSANYASDVQDLLNLGKSSGTGVVAAAIAKQGRGPFLKLSASIDHLIAIQTGESRKLYESSLAAEHGTIVALISVTAIAALAGILLAIFISAQIDRPMKLVKERIAQLQSACVTNLGNGLLAIAGGDLDNKVEKVTQPLQLSRQDEIGEIARTVDQIIYRTQSSVDAYEEVRNALKELLVQTESVRQSTVVGELGKRADVRKLNGAYRTILEAFNKTLEEIVAVVMKGEDVMARISEGDLTARMEGEYRGNYKNLQDHTRLLGESLEKVISEVRESVEVTASSSTEISASIEQMAAGAQEQSAQAIEVAGAVEEMAKTIMETTKNTGALADAAKESRRIAGEGGDVIGQTIEGMDRIAQVVKMSSEKIQRLGKSSSEIGEIIQVIDDIADQTNLLALNAAIEAARAGEQGRGFAVVADEVRRLAERTTKATKEIAEMIQRIQAETGEAVGAIDAGNAEVERGKKLADKAGEALREIVQGSDKVAHLVSQVAAASEQQSTAAEQISRNIEGISSVSSESASGTQQIANAANDLNRLTENLRILISRFKVSELRGRMSDEKRGRLVVAENGAIQNA